MGVVGVVGNAFVILSRLLVREKNRVHSFYIKNLAFADLLMGLFLLSIASHDVSFRGHFLAKQHAWRHSLTCQWSGKCLSKNKRRAYHKIPLFRSIIHPLFGILRPGSNPNYFGSLFVNCEAI
jgi:hypothetical protein